MTGLATSINLQKYFPFIERCIEKNGTLKICVSEFSNESIDSLPWKKLYGFMAVDGGPIQRLSGPQSKIMHDTLMPDDDHRAFITYG